MELAEPLYLLGCTETAFLTQVKKVLFGRMSSILKPHELMVQVQTAMVFYINSRDYAGLR